PGDSRFVRLGTVDGWLIVSDWMPEPFAAALELPLRPTVQAVAAKAAPPARRAPAAAEATLTLRPRFLSGLIFIGRSLSECGDAVGGSGQRSAGPGVSRGAGGSRCRTTGRRDACQARHLEERVRAGEG